MPGNFRKEDLRIIKTRKALFSAFLSLLGRYTFGKITVHDICAEALVSRTAFYAHFSDKYDMLSQWLDTIRVRFTQDFRTQSREQTEADICALFRRHYTVIENLFKDGDREQMDLLLQFFTQGSHDGGGDFSCTPPDMRRTILTNFLSGGIFNVVFFQVRRRRPVSDKEIHSMVACMYPLVQSLLEQEDIKKTEAIGRG